MLEKNNRLLESILSLSILNILNMLLPLVTLPYMIKVIGMANYGAYSVTYVIIQYALLISSYGFNYSTTKRIAQHKENLDYINLVFNATIAAKFMLAILSICLFYGIILMLFPVFYSYMFLLGLGIILGDLLNPVWLFQGMERMRYMTYVNVICKLLFTILIFVFIRKPEDYIYITLLNSIGFLCSGFISLYIACHFFHLKLSIPNFNDIMLQLKDGWYVFLSTLFMNLYRNSNVFILGLAVNETLVGIYASAEKVIKASQSIVSPISNALFPYLADSFTVGTIGSKILRIRKISIVISVFLIILSCLIWLFAPIINSILLNNEQGGTIDLIRIMVPVILFGGLNYILGIAGLINLGYQGAFFRYVMFSGIVSIVFMLLTVSFWKIYSAAFAMCVSEFLLFVMCIYKLKNLR